MNTFLAYLFCICFAYAPAIKVLVHDDCIYSQSLIALLKWSGTPYEKLDLDKNQDLLKKDKHIPKVFVDSKLIGGYRDSIINWKMIFKMIPYESDPQKLLDPEYVVKTYSNKIGNEKDINFVHLNDQKNVTFSIQRRIKLLN
jgi:glutaredoxin